MPDISDLLKDAANIFAQLAAAYEDDCKRTQDHIAHTLRIKQLKTEKR